MAGLIVAHGVKRAKVHDARLAATILAYKLDAILTFNADDFARFPPYRGRVTHYAMTTEVLRP